MTPVPKGTVRSTSGARTGTRRMEHNAVWFGRGGNGSASANPYPQVRGLVVTDCRTRWLLGGAYGPYTGGEQTLALDLLAAIDSSMLVLTDRGFASWKLWRAMAATGAQLCWRRQARASRVRIPSSRPCDVVRQARRSDRRSRGSDRLVADCDCCSVEAQVAAHGRGSLAKLCELPPSERVDDDFLGLFGEQVARACVSCCAAATAPTGRPVGRLCRSPRTAGPSAHPDQPSSELMRSGARSSLLHEEHHSS